MALNNLRGGGGGQGQGVSKGLGGGHEEKGLGDRTRVLGAPRAALGTRGLWGERGQTSSAPPASGGPVVRAVTYLGH